MRDIIEQGAIALVISILCVLAVIGCVPARENPKPVSAPSSTVDLFSQSLTAFDGSTLTVECSPCEIAFDGGSLVLSQRTVARITREVESLKIEFAKPCPRGKTRKLGMSFSAGVETVIIERDKVSAFTETLGKKFVWQLRESP